jgi:hypothetical protein
MADPASFFTTLNRRRPWLIPTVVVAAIVLGTVGLAASLSGRLGGHGGPTALAAVSPGPSPSSALPGARPSPLSVATRLPAPSPSRRPPSSAAAPPVAARAALTRGIFRYTSTDFATMRSLGFNAATDGGVQDHGPAEAAAGITGMVWVDAYNNSSCAQTMTNATIQGLVQANVNAGRRGLRYEIGDEPTANGCNAAPVYRSITQAVHAIDSTAKTWTADDQFQEGNPPQAGVPMKGSVDILAFDVYPCESGPCDYATIDSAVRQIHAAGVRNWEFIIQDFSSSPWRWPTSAEILTQFNHWKGKGAIGYWVYAWDYQGQQVSGQPGNLAALKQINSE